MTAAAPPAHRAAPAPRLLGLGLLLASEGAWAHGSFKGAGDFIAGLLHPVLEPAHLIVMLVLGLLLGQRGLRGNQPALPALLAGVLVGLAVARFGKAAVGTDTLLLCLAVAGGLSVAIARPLAQVVVAAAALLVGLGIGLASAPDPGAASAEILMALGVALGVVWWTADVAIVVQALRRPWMQIGTRVVGSWLTAVALLVLALWLR